MTADLAHDPPESLAVIRSLDEALAEPEPTDWQTPVPPQGLARANRYARRLAILEREALAIEKAAAAQQLEIGVWREREMDRLSRSMGWLIRSLEGWHRNTHERGGPKSVRLATGHSLSLTKPRGHVEVTDEAAFLAWALGCSCGHPAATHATVPGEPDILHAGPCCAHVSAHHPPCPCEAYERQAPNLVRETAPKPAETHPAKAELGKLPNNAGVLLLGGESIPGVTYEIAPEDVFKIEPGDES